MANSQSETRFEGMNAKQSRAKFWNELRSAIRASRKARSVDLRDRCLDEAGHWAKRLADTALPPEPADESYFLSEAMADVGDEGWSIPL